MPIPRAQLRLDPEELDQLLSSAREAHVATVSPSGSPHVAPLWFVWHQGALWLNSLIKSRRTRDIRAGSPVAVCVDAGAEYSELRGAVFEGRFADATDHSELPAVKMEFAKKYWGGTEVPGTKSHVWLRLEIETIASWDFRKIPAGRDVRLDAVGTRAASPKRAST